MYEHTQRGLVLNFLLIGGALLTGAVLLHFGSEADLAPGVIGTVLAVFLIPLLLFHSLKVRVDYNNIEVAFGFGLIRRTIPLAQVLACRSVRNKWWYGWGIRLLPGGVWMYNIAGLDAVELDFKNGKKFRIGTDEPQKLGLAISQRLSTRG